MDESKECGVIPGVIGTCRWEYTYDGRGNLVSVDKYTRTTTGMDWENVAAYVYDETNHMVDGKNELGERSLYTYNGLGVRVGRELIMQDNTHGYTDFHTSTPSVETGLTTPEVVKESYVVDYTTATRETLMMHEEGGFDYRWTYGLDKLNVKVTSEGTNWWGQNVKEDILKDYAHQDRMGSTTNMTDKFGRIVGRADYNEWGEITFKDYLSITSAYRRIYPQLSYTGHDWDDVLGMYYAKARFYSADSKRFVSMDPVKGDVFEPLSLVPYIYCVDNPLKYVDPMGLMNYFTQTDDLLAGVGQGIYDSTIGAIINLPETGKMLVELVKGVVSGDLNLSELVKILFDTTLGDYRTVITKIDTLDPSSKKTDKQVYEYGRAVGAVATDIVMTLVGGKIIDAAIDFLKETKVGQKILDLVDDFAKHTDDVADVKTGSRGNSVDVDVGNGKGADIGNGKSADAGNGASGKSYFDNAGCLEEQSVKTQSVVDDLKRITVKDTLGAKFPRPDTKPLLQRFADMANEKLNKLGYTQGSVAGTKKHTEFKRLIDEYVKDMDNPYLKTEVSVRRNGSTFQGYPYEANTIRLDVVEYGPNGDIVAVYDLKTGGAKLTASRIKEIRDYLHMPNLPVYEIHPST